MVLFSGKCQHGQVGPTCLDCYRLALADAQDELKAKELQIERLKKHESELLTRKFDLETSLGIKTNEAAIAERLNQELEDKGKTWICPKDYQAALRLNSERGNLVAALLEMLEPLPMNWQESRTLVHAKRVVAELIESEKQSCEHEWNWPDGKTSMPQVPFCRKCNVMNATEVSTSEKRKDEGCDHDCGQDHKRVVSGPKCGACDQVIEGEPYCHACYIET